MTKRKPINILVLCTKFPWPPKDGGTRAMMSMIEGFHKAGNNVTVLTMNTPKTLCNTPHPASQYSAGGRIYCCGCEYRCEDLGYAGKYIL